jgi:hypothetical protein
MPGIAIYPLLLSDKIRGQLLEIPTIKIREIMIFGCEPLATRSGQGELIVM